MSQTGGHRGAQSDRRRRRNPPVQAGSGLCPVQRTKGLACVGGFSDVCGRNRAGARVSRANTGRGTGLATLVPGSPRGEGGGWPVPLLTRPSAVRRHRPPRDSALGELVFPVSAYEHEEREQGGEPAQRQDPQPGRDRRGWRSTAMVLDPPQSHGREPTPTLGRHGRELRGCRAGFAHTHRARIRWSAADTSVIPRRGRVFRGRTGDDNQLANTDSERHGRTADRDACRNVAPVRVWEQLLSACRRGRPSD